MTDTDDEQLKKQASYSLENHVWMAAKSGIERASAAALGSTDIPDSSPISAPRNANWPTVTACWD
jgi:hypothetical protein